METKETDKFYFDLEEPNQSCMLALKSIILSLDERIVETRKWGLPCFCYKKRMFCFLSIDPKDIPYLLVVEGNLINHPLLKTNGRKRMKSISFDPNEDLPIAPIREILNSALDLYRNGIIKTR